MRRISLLLATLATLAATAGTAAAAPAPLPVSAASTTEAVAAFDLLDPVAGSARSIGAAGGVYFRLCDRGSFRPCRLGAGAETARREAYALARSTLAAREHAPVVVIGLPQTATRYAFLVFERDVLLEPADPLRSTAERLYAAAGLLACSPRDDCLQLVRLRVWPAPPSGR